MTSLETDSSGLLTAAKSSIVTYSGRVINPGDPDATQIDIKDIAHSLSNQCRYTGHSKKFYSVAQHSFLVSVYVDPKYALWGLLHDASEAYLSDIARPIKRSYTGLAEAYSEAEEKLMRAVAIRFNLEWPMPEEVRQTDDLLLRTEVKELMPFDIPGATLDIDLIPWQPGAAKLNFMGRYKVLTQ